MVFKHFSRGSMKPTTGEKVGWQSNISASLTFTGLLRIATRFIQIVLAIAVIGLYAQDLDKARKMGKYQDSKWMFATVVGAISAISAIILVVPKVKSWILFPWDFIIFILWAGVFGTFGKMYIGEDPEGNGGIQRMKNAVWIDLVNMLLWFMSGTYGAFIFWKWRRGRTIHTGAASAHA